MNKLYTFPAIYYNRSVTANAGGKKAGERMTEKEMLKVSVEEFSRVQKYMLLIQDKDSAAYKEIRDRYIELNHWFNSCGRGWRPW